MKPFILFLLLLSAWLPGPGTACLPAAELPKQIVVAMRSGDNLPYQYESDDNAPRGLYIEIVQMAAQRVGVPVQLESYPWKRCLQMARHGAVDAVVGLFRNEKNQAFFYFVDEPLAYEETTLFTYQGSPVIYQGDLAPLYHYTLGKVRGASYYDQWEKIQKRFVRIEESNSLTSLLRKLHRRRLDLIIGNKLVIFYNLEMLGLIDDIVDLQPSLTLNSGHLAFSKAKGPSHQQLAYRFNQAVQAVKASTAYDRLLEKYSQF